MHPMHPPPFSLRRSDHPPPTPWKTYKIRINRHGPPPPPTAKNNNIPRTPCKYFLDPHLNGNLRICCFIDFNMYGNLKMWKKANLLKWQLYTRMSFFCLYFTVKSTVIEVLKDVNYLNNDKKRVLYCLYPLTVYFL